MRKWLIAFVLFAINVARASTFSSDWSDLWFNENEPGWGINLIQQSDTIFGTLFVYSGASQATWYVAPATTFQGVVGGAQVFAGPLYQTTGNWFGQSAFNPNAVNARQVGTLTINFSSLISASITYSVDGVSVSKIVTRQTWRANDMTGTYVGAAVGTYSGCPTGNGYFEEPGVMSIAQSGSNATVVIATNTGRSCTYSGAIVQGGRLLGLSVSASCNDGSRGTGVLTEIDAQLMGFTGRGTVTFGACQWTGKFGGLRRGAL